jgi:opacity protein-like surface antigen
MKKYIFTILLLVSAISVANGQFTKVGGGLALTSGFQFHQMDYPENRSGLIGLYFKGIYEVTLPLHIAPSFTIFYPHTTKGQVDKTVVSSMMFDINGHYTFNSLDRFEFYGIAGLDILFAKKKNVYEVSGTFKESDNALGLNIGVGSYMKLTEQFDLSGEIKYVFNNKYNQIMANVGILINIDWLKKNENNGGL